MRKIHIEAIDKIVNLGMRVLAALAKRSNKPDEVKQPKVYKMGDVEKMIGKNRKTIIALESSGLMKPSIKTASGHRYLTLEHINFLRQRFGGVNWRQKSDEPLIMAIMNNKGGVGKSVGTITLSHGLAELGYRVLIIDLDPQATTTATCGYIPDHDDIGFGKGIADESTIIPFMSLETDNLKYAVRETTWDGLKLIPANLQTHGLEYMMSSQMNVAKNADERLNVFRRLKKGIDSVKSDFDVVILDTPPSFGFIPLSILVAADALLVPCPARLYDFHSTVQFFRMVQQVMLEIEPNKTYKWIKLLVTQYAPTQVGQDRLAAAIRDQFGDLPMVNPFFDSADINSASERFESIYEFKSTRKRTVDMVDLVVKEVEGLIRSTWEPRVNNNLSIQTIDKILA